MSAIKKPKMPNEGLAEAIPRPDNISLFPSRIAAASEDREEPKRSWWFRRAVEAGFIAMPNTQPKTPGFYVNWTTISSVLVIIATILGGWYFTYTWTWNAAYQKGKDDELNRQRDAQIEKLQKELQQTKDLSIAAASQAGHEEEPKEKKK